jgi:hypothetical protein
VLSVAMMGPNKSTVARRACPRCILPGTGGSICVKFISNDATLDSDKALLKNRQDIAPGRLRNIKVEGVDLVLSHRQF